MKATILILLIFFSCSLNAQTQEKKQVKIEKSELGIARDFNFEYRLLEPGIYSKDTLPIITIYNLYERNLNLESGVISKFGKGFDIVINSTYQFKEELIRRLSEQTGPAPILYLDHVLIPEIRFAARTAVGKYTFEGLDKKKAEKEILDLLKGRLDSGVIVNTTKIQVINNK